MLWGNKDYATGNNKPLYANTTNTTSNSVINGTSANLFYGIVAGVSATEETTSASLPQHPTHAGWVSLKVGTGPISGVTLTNGGNVNAAGFIIVTDGSVTGTGTGANISYTVNTTTNTVNSVTLVSGGSGYTNVSALTYVVSSAANTTQPTLSFTLGGRAGRIQTETLVAMGSITEDDPKDNVYFSGV
jgi:hypothetical protein